MDRLHPSSAPSTETESDKPSGGILSKKKHRHRRRHRDKKSTDKLAGPNRKLSSEVATTQPSHAATGPMGSVVSVDAVVIQAPQTSPVPTGPADLQQGPFVAQPQMFTQIQQPMEFQPQMAHRSCKEVALNRVRPTLTAGGNLVASATTPTSFIDHASHAKVADRRKGEREFDRQVGENVLDNQGVHNAQRDDVVEDIGPFRRARAGSVTRLNRKSQTWKHQNRASVSHQQEETPSFNTDGSTQSFDPAISLVSEPVPTTAVIINAEMAQRLITALQKCEGQPPKDATPDVSEAAHVKLRGRESDEKLKATEAEGFTETLRPRRTSADRLGSSEEFYEVIAEEVIEPDKNTEGGQRKRIVRKTTRSRKHDVIEEPWEGW
ncbi:hypothetical protein MRX96_056621 [Rhipicephalus microplus]